MGLGNQGGVGAVPLRALAGIQTGVLGGLAMWGWLAASSAVDRQPVWTIPNLLASVVYGRDVLRRDFSGLTITGLALHLFAAGLAGLLFGLLIGESQNRLRVALLGLLTGLVWYHFSEVLFWRKLGALAAIYSPVRPMLLAHLIYGFVLAWYPGALEAARRQFPREPAPPAAPEAA